MFSLESDQMTASWQNDCLTFTFYVIISNSTSNLTAFVKEVASQLKTNWVTLSKPWDLSNQMKLKDLGV